MPAILHVQWTITPKIPPQPRRSCSDCGEIKPFRSSGAIRLNASGKTLDAWLIYRCADCDSTWNRPIFQRRNIRDIAPDMLQALHTNDPEWISALAFDVEHVRRQIQQIDEFADADVRKLVLLNGERPWLRLDLLIRVSRPTCLRIDRLLAAGLTLSRARIQILERSGRLTVAPEKRQPLRRAVQDQMLITIDLSNESDGLAIGLAAMNPA